MTTPASQVWESILLAVAVELPLAAICMWLSYHTQHLADRRIRLLLTGRLLRGTFRRGTFRRGEPRRSRRPWRRGFTGDRPESEPAGGQAGP
jgi:hypothetical protein